MTTDVQVPREVEEERLAKAAQAALEALQQAAVNGTSNLLPLSENYSAAQKRYNDFMAANLVPKYVDWIKSMSDSYKEIFTSLNNVKSIVIRMPEDPTQSIMVDFSKNENSGRKSSTRTKYRFNLNGELLTAQQFIIKATGKDKSEIGRNPTLEARELAEQMNIEVTTV